MRINNIQKTIRGDRARISATYIWEDSDRPEIEVYIETTSEFAEDLAPNANAFLLGGAIPAMVHGERRVCVEGQVCPELRNGLVTAMQLLQLWHKKEACHPIAIEATQGFIPEIPRTPARVASFQSGGVDALATVRSNRLDIPLEHPASIKDCLMIHGLDLGGFESLDENLEAFEYARNRLDNLGQAEHFTLIPVYTNLRHLDDDSSNLFLFYVGAILAAIAHAFTPRISTALIASSDSVQDLIEMGTHPLLDPNYSSADLRIVHDGIRFSRSEKVGLITQWDAGLQSLRVCWDAFRPADSLNCGRCEKCLRTMAQLLLRDKLKDCRAFPFDDISPELLNGLRVGPVDFSAPKKEMFNVAIHRITYATVEYWEELVDEFTKIGRHDLAEVIQSKLAEREQLLKREYKESFRQKMARLDNRVLGGQLRRVFRKFQG